MTSSNENMVKIKIPLPPNDPSGGEAEWLWAEPRGNDRFVVRNVPTFVYGLSYGDTVTARQEDGALVFNGITERGGHSTYRAYTKNDRRSPEVTAVLDTLRKMHCAIEPAMSRVVGVDVLPEADIYEVYRALEEAEGAGILEFEEGHCGHSLHA